MLVAVLLPVLIGLFLMAMERFEARVPDEDVGGAVPGGGGGLPSDERRRTPTRGGTFGDSVGL